MAYSKVRVLTVPYASQGVPCLIVRGTSVPPQLDKVESLSPSFQE